MRYGYWHPVFERWLRNVADERTDASWPYVKPQVPRTQRQNVAA